MTRPSSMAFKAIVLIACVAAAGCGRSDPYAIGPVAPTPAAPSTNLVIDVAEINRPYSFYQNPANVRSSQVIIWRNSDTVTHHVVFDDLSVDMGTPAPGTLSQPIVLAPGNSAYHCAIHPAMTGRVTVTASSGSDSGQVIMFTVLRSARGDSVDTLFG